MNEICVLKVFFIIRLGKERKRAFPRMGGGETKSGINMHILLVSTNRRYHSKVDNCGFPLAYHTLLYIHYSQSYISLCYPTPLNPRQFGFVDTKM